MKYLQTLSLITVCFFAFSSFFLSPIESVQAATGGNDPLGLYYAGQTGLSGGDVRITIARTIRAILGLLGILSVSIIIYAGFVMMMSGGNEEKTKSARKILFSAVIGLAIILSAFIITQFVIFSLYEATSGIPYGPS